MSGLDKLMNKGPSTEDPVIKLTREIKEISDERVKIFLIIKQKEQEFNKFKETETRRAGMLVLQLQKKDNEIRAWQAARNVK